MRATLLFMSLGLASPALAAGPLEWCAPDASLHVSFRGADLYKRLVDGVGERFAGVPTFDAAIKRLRELEVQGLKPYDLKLGEGLDLSKGVALCASAKKKGRFIVGATDENKALNALATTLGRLGTEAIVAGTNLNVGEQVVHCGLRGGYLVCDAAAAPPAKPAPPPAWLAKAPVPTDGLFFLRVTGEAGKQIMKGAPVDTLWMGLAPTETGMQPSVEVVPAAGTMGPIATMLGDGKTKSSTLEVVDLRSPSLLKLGLDAPKMIAFAKGMGGTPPELAPLVAALEAAWTGDLTLSFAGSFGNPVLALGLRDEKAAQPLLQALADLASKVNPKKVSATVEAGEIGHFKVAVQEGGNNLRLRVPFTVHGGNLVLAGQQADLKRIRAGKVRKGKLPELLAAQGTHGFVARGPWSLLGWGFGSGLVEFDKPAQYASDGFLVGAAWTALVDELGLLVSLRPESVRARLWWSLL